MRFTMGSLRDQYWTLFLSLSPNIILYYIILYYITLYYTILYYIKCLLYYINIYIHIYKLILLYYINIYDMFFREIEIYFENYAKDTTPYTCEKIIETPKKC